MQANKRRNLKNFRKEFDVFIAQKIQKGENFIHFTKECHKKGIKVIYIGIDKINIDFAIAGDGIILVSKHLEKKIPQEHSKKIFRVFDGFEHNGEKQKKHTDSNEITLVFTSNNVFSEFPQIKKLPTGVKLKIIGPRKEYVMKYPYNPEGKIFSDTKYDFKYAYWKLKTVENEILKCDVAVIPYPDELLKEDFIVRKSSNRLIMFMSYGLPTIVSPHPEYIPLVEQGKNGFIARTPKEWNEFIKLLRDQPEKRKEIGKNARESVIDKYSLNAQGELYLKIIKDVVESK